MEIQDKITAQTKKRMAAIAKKVHPALAPILRAYGEGLKAVEALGKNRPNELVVEIGIRMFAKLRKVAQEYPEIPGSAMTLVYSDLSCPEKEVDAEKAMLEFFHFQRHRRPLSADLKASTMDGEALKRLGRTFGDYGMALSGDGPIKPGKGNQDHADIFIFGLEMGLEKLTADELAEFFNENCWCGNPDHDAAALKKHRKRIQESLYTGVKPAAIVHAE